MTGQSSGSQKRRGRFWLRDAARRRCKQLLHFSAPYGDPVRGATNRSIASGRAVVHTTVSKWAYRRE